MMAKDLVKWLLENPDLDVMIFDGVNLVDLNTITMRDKGDNNLFDKNDDNGVIKINSDFIIKDKFIKGVYII